MFIHPDGSFFALAVVASIAGMLIGTVGVGGVVLVAYLALFAGLTIHQSAATALLSFVFTGILGTWLYHRRGSIDWRITLPVCAAALVFGWLGALVASQVDPKPLAILISLVIVFAGVYVFLPQRSPIGPRDGRAARESILLTSVGAVSGFGSGLSGAGGPLFAVPLMVILRYLPLTAVATSQVLQIVAAASGSVENLRHGFIDFEVAFVITIFELAGVVAGVRLAHASSPVVLRRLAGALCLLSGGVLLLRSI